MQSEQGLVVASMHPDESCRDKVCAHHLHLPVSWLAWLTRFSGPLSGRSSRSRMGCIALCATGRRVILRGSVVKVLRDQSVTSIRRLFRPSSITRRGRWRNRSARTTFRVEYKVDEVGAEREAEAARLMFTTVDVMITPARTARR